MANQVQFNITFHQMNDYAKAELSNMFSRFRKGEKWFADMFVTGNAPSPTYEEVQQYSWTTNHIGPKWCYVEEANIGEDNFNLGDASMSGYSAWDPPKAGLEMILNHLVELDPHMITSMTYDDESLIFVGAYVWAGNECVGGAEDDFEDIIGRMQNSFPELKGKWDADEGAWKDDESETLYDENLWETLNEYTSSIVDNNVNNIMVQQRDSRSTKS